MGVQLLPQSVKVKTLSYTIVMPSELKARLAQPGFPKGVGGWQSLIKGIQSQIEGDHLELSQALLTEMVGKATQYGSGGYQGLIRWILCLLLAQHTEAVLGKPQSLKDAMKEQIKAKGKAKDTVAPVATQTAQEGAVA